MKTSLIINSDKKRFFNKVRKTKKCWIWNGAKTSKGYGRFKIKGKLKLSHRISYLIRYGMFDENMFICHKCDNPRCVKPSHLFLGTRSDNMIDCYEKGRLYIGKGNFLKGHKDSAILTDRKVIKIKKMIQSGEKLISISKKFKIKYQTIRDLSSGRTYYNVKE